MKTTDLLTIDGQPMPVPDEDLVMVEEDVVSSDSGMDESGVYHRFGVREGVKSWEFSYARLTREEYAYLEELFTGRDTFIFGFPSAIDGAHREVTVYRSKRSIVWHSADGQYRDFRFRLTQC